MDTVHPTRCFTQTARCTVRDAHIDRSGPGSVVGIATGHGLEGPETESRWVARFSAPVHTGPGAHPASFTVGTGSILVVQNGRGVKLTTDHLLVP